MRVAILVADMYEDLELWYPYLRIKEKGGTVDLIAAEKNKEYKSKHGYPAVSKIAASDANKNDYNCCIIPGGYAPDHIRRSKEMISFVQGIYRNKGILAAICHGGWILCSIPEAIKGRKVTSFFSIRDDMINAGAEYVDREVVVDGQVITARKPADLPAFMKAIFKSLSTNKK